MKDIPDHIKLIKRKIKQYPFLKDLYSSRLKFLKKIKDENGKDLRDLAAPSEEGSFSIEEIARYNAAGYSIYFFANQPKTIYTNFRGECRKHHMGTVRFLFADMDFKDAVYKSIKDFRDKIKSLFPLEPSFVVKTGHGCHVYWVVSGVSISEFKNYQTRLMRLFNTDPVTDEPRVLRLPYTYNVKDLKDIRLCKILSCKPENKYTAKEFDKVLPKIVKGRPRKKHTSLGNKVYDLSLPKPAIFLELAKADPDLNLLLSSNKGMKKQSASKAKNTRSENDFRLACSLFRYGLSPDEIYAVLITSYKALEYADTQARVRYVLRTIEHAISEPDYANYYAYYNGDWGT